MAILILPFIIFLNIIIILIMITLLLIAFGLAMDCFAVSMAGGALHRKPELRNALKIASMFGIFQALMPLIGWFAGREVSRLISNFDHWAAFILLTVIGSKLIYESFKGSGVNKKDMFKLPTLILLSVATSIDALVVGISLGLLDTPLIISFAVIGIFAFVLSFIGYYIGHLAGNMLGRRVEIIGGLILIGLGIKILVENLN